MKGAAGQELAAPLGQRTEEQRIEDVLADRILIHQPVNVKQHQVDIIVRPQPKFPGHQIAGVSEDLLKTTDICLDIVGQRLFLETGGRQQPG